LNNDLLRIGAAYVRVSDERQDEYSPDSQLKKIREYAAKEGYMIPDEYVFYDDGISGRSVKKRDDFKRMISVAKEKTHPFDKIYVWKFSRFARNQEEAIVYKSLLAKNKVYVVSVSEPIQEGHFGALQERIIEWMDEFYSINLSGEVIRGMTEKASRGEPTCPPPYGYIMKDGKYYPDEESGSANIVREVFTLYSNGAKQREIAVTLGDRGVRTKYGNMPDNRWIEYMLRNPCYIGKIRWSREGARAVSKRDFENENIMIVDGHHEPIISMELWEKVQKMLDNQKKAYPKYAKKNQQVDYMLKGLVRCSSCGSTLAAAGASGKACVRYLQCCSYARGSCNTSHAITIPNIEAAFMEGIKLAVAEKQFPIISSTSKKENANTVDFDKLIAVEERRLVRAKEAYLAEIDTIEQYAQNKKDITERIEKLKSRRDKEIIKEIDFDAFADKVAGIVEFIEREDVTPSAKNEALHNIIEKIVYEKANNNLAIYFHDI
jgi:DNA invertase Pin-like site-specific DNA recombinase